MQVLEKWSKLLSTRIDPDKAAATICVLYQRVGYPSPKVVFVDSPWAASVAAGLLIHQSSNTLSSVRNDLLNLFRQVDAQLLRQLVKQFDNLRNCLEFAAHLSEIAAIHIYFHDEAEDYWGYEATADPCPEYPRTRLDDLSLLVERFKVFGLIPSQQYEWSDGIEPYRRCYLNDNQISELLNCLNHRLIQQLDVQTDEFPLAAPLSFPLIKPIRCGEITSAAVFDFAASVGTQFEPELLALFLESALHLGFINPFKEICFVSDRPQFNRDTQNNLHAEGEPAVVFPDGFGMSYFYHGIELPQYCGAVHPSRWKPQWIVQEQNVEVRRVLIREIGYARMCQELEAEELDFWREYTLLELPIYDDYSQIPPLPPWKNPKEVEGIKAIYLLKMTCPSTGHIYALRVPPNMRSAREAATWVNWGNDPTWFSAET
jgi:hypothetical protein